MKRQTKKKIKQAAKNFSIALLDTIVAIARAMPQPLESKGQYQRRVWREMRDYPLTRVQLGLARLKKQGYVRSSPKHPTLQLTVTGQIRYLSHQIFLKKKENKNFATIVLFDIPEEKSRYRKFLRRLLLKNGFINLRKSALIGRFDLPEEFFKLITELKIRQNVTVIKGRVDYN